MPLAEKMSKSGIIFRFYILTPALLPGTCDASEVWATLRWTYSPRLVTVSPPKLKIFHFILYLGGMTLWTNGQTNGWMDKMMDINEMVQYAILQLRIVRSGLHLVTYLDVGNFCDKSTETIYMKFVCNFFLDFPIPASQARSELLIYKLAWLAGIRKSILANFWECCGRSSPPTQDCWGGGHNTRQPFPHKFELFITISKNMYLIHRIIN